MKKGYAKDILFKVLTAAEDKNYEGFSKFDALNSPLLAYISQNSKWLRLIFTQAVKASPFHIRPLLGVIPSRNPKGIALFARAYISLYQKTGYPDFRRKAQDLLDWLLRHPSPGQSHMCWGYNFVWQNTIFLQAKKEPNIVVTVFVGEALLHAFELTGNPRYLNAAASVGKFITTGLPILFNSGEEAAVAYVQRQVDAIVLNNQVLAGAFLIKLWKHTQEKNTKEMAVRLINFTINRKTDYHAWYYTYPKKKSPITHDNYHTGGIIDGLLDYYETTGDDRYHSTYLLGLDFYHHYLFTSDGAPKWMHDKTYPHDIHGSAQGIITFSRANKHAPEYREICEKIIDWTLIHLYKPKTHDFIYRKGRLLTWNYSLMRWCNAWMVRALAEAELNLEQRTN